MHGDFSRFRFDPREHRRGVAQPADAALRNREAVLQQQGRPITDADWTEGELLDLAWQAQAGRDLIGAGVCAVPVDEPASFRVDSAAVVGSDVMLALRPGRAWVDGLLARLPGTAAQPRAALARRASYYGAPLPGPLPTAAEIGEGVHDVVFLEAWHDVLHAYQHPEALVEPALGGVDTSERAFLNLRLRLLRVAADEDCHAAAARLADDPSGQGRLSVSLAPVTAVGGDCPVVGEGGYSGLEHQLYRIEIADGEAGAPLRFKWSGWNGGLVGRGRFVTSGSTTTVQIVAGRSAITSAGLLSFYLEALYFDAAEGRWRVGLGSPATLNAAGDLELAAPPTFGSLPATTAPVFFRLWNELREVAEFPQQAEPAALRDGIRLAFDPGAPGRLLPGDYWTFEVRAGEISNAALLIDHQPPQGIEYHRVPLAEIHWHGGGAQPISAEIEDCRQRFRPLTQQKTCCTFLVGDGRTSFGDFDSIEEAAAQLAAEGGELCLLPGLHRANLRLEGRRNVVLHGCAGRTLVVPRAAGAPLLHFIGCTAITLHTLDLVSADDSALLFDGGSELRVADSRVVGRINALRLQGVAGVQVTGNRLHVLDTADGRAVLSVLGDDVAIERNTLVVLPFSERPRPGPGTPAGDPPEDPADPCATPQAQYDFPKGLQAYAQQAWQQPTGDVGSGAAYRAIGGIHLRPGSERVRIERNTVAGGAGHGVTLGGDLDASEATPLPETPLLRVEVPADGLFAGLLVDEQGAPLAGVDVFLDAQGVATDRSDAQGLVGIKSAPGSALLTVAPSWRVLKLGPGGGPLGTPQVLTLAPQAAPSTFRGFLHDLAIADNDIAGMGLSGIGVGLRIGVPLVPPPYTLPEKKGKARILAAIDFAILALALTPVLRATDPVRTLLIRGNRLHHNLQLPFGPLMQAAAQVLGFGGITLGAAEAVRISGNHIHDNGPSAANPACGIFLAYVDDAEISDNVLADNGVVDADYEQKAQAGLRGGIFVRFAGALTAPYSASTGRKPAVRVNGNRVDQGAGRALTIYAFGPVAVNGNHLNSEHSGRFGFTDAAVGGVLVLNLGGLHRVLARRLGSLLDDDGLLASLFERGLPGGETLVDDNLLRIGAPNRSLIGNVLLSFDDLGFASNTSSLYRPGPLLGNLLLVADTLRATASRLREDALCTFSLVGLSLRATLAALNQCDHRTWLPPSRGPGAVPPETGFNQVLKPDDCPLDQPSNKDLAGLFDTAVAAYAAELGVVKASMFDAAEIHALAQDYGAAAIGAVGQTQAVYNQALLAEAARVAARRGPADPAARALRARADAGAQATRLLATAAELMRVRPTAPPEGGAAFSARVVNARGQGLRGFGVALLRRNGKLLLEVGQTDEVGHVEMLFSAEQAAAMEKEGEVFLRVADAAGHEVLRDSRALRLAPGVEARRVLPVPPRPTPIRGDDARPPVRRPRRPAR